MRQFTERETYGLLRNGIRFVIPLTDSPIKHPPCRAIAEAAGIPGVADGSGRLTRKRFIRLVMSTGNSIRDAEYLAWAAHLHGVSYRDCLQRTLVPQIMKADRSVQRIFSGEIMKRMELVKDETVQDSGGKEENCYVMPVQAESEGRAEV